MNFAVETVEKKTNTVVTLDFKGSLDFTIDENGMVVDGNKTVTHQELYEMIAPKEEPLLTDELETQEEWRQE